MRPSIAVVAIFAVSAIAIGALAAFSSTDDFITAAVAPRPAPAAVPGTTLPVVSFKADPALPNVTADMTAELAKDIIARNPEGPATIDAKQWINVLDPETAAAAIAAEGLKNFNPADFQPEITNADLNISADASPTAIRLYLKTFRDILQHNFSAVRVDFASAALTGIGDLIAVYDRAIKDFYRLTAPAPLADIHRREISLLTGQKKVFERLANYQQDPVQAVIALRAYEELGEQFNQLNTAVAQFIADNNLTI